jgi:predicted Ser/Thr protein kinase
MEFDIKNAVGTCLETYVGNIRLARFLGRGKSGYSYLGKSKDSEYIVKLMHDEPCPYYSFGESNKVDIEVLAYQFLNDLGLPLPKLFMYDLEDRFLVKEYIKGGVATELIASGNAGRVIEQLYKMSNTAKNAGINLDYFPANFISRDGVLYYIDYEYNEYQSEWDLGNWGIYYWANTQGMRQFLNTGDISTLNQSVDSGIPIKHSFEAIVESWNSKFG